MEMPANFRNIITRDALKLFLARRMSEKEVDEFMAKLDGNLFEILPGGELKSVTEKDFL